MWHRIAFSLSLAANLLPGLTMELMERQPFRKGGTFIDAWHPFVCRRADDELRGCGFHPLGHLLCKHMPGWVFRCYHHHSGTAWAVHYVGLAVGSSYDIVTRFEEGEWLTSTTSPVSGNRIGQTIQSRPEADLYRLAELHFERTRGRNCTLTAGGLEGIVEAMERFFAETRDIYL